MLTLKLYTNNKTLRSLYEQRCNYENDAGVDLYIPETVTIDAFQTKCIDLEIKCKLEDENGTELGYFLYPRSSIIKTPLLLANSVGVVDIGYRNTVKAALRHIPYDVNNKSSNEYIIEQHTRLVQIVAPSMKPIKVQLVDEEFETSSRGLGGFGSTGK